MGVAVIAGLTVATVLTLVIVPVTYHTLDELPQFLNPASGYLQNGERIFSANRYLREQGGARRPFLIDKVLDRCCRRSR